jgi:hypothetical protein
MNTVEELPLTSVGHRLDTSPEALGELRESSLWIDDAEALRTRMEEDGYLYLRGFFQRDDVMKVRRELVTRMTNYGLLEPGTDPMDAISRVTPVTNGPTVGNNDFTNNNPILDGLIYGPHIMSFYRHFFGEAARHFDFTWMRMMAHGKGTTPHCDVVYMGRGTREKLLTAWIPMGDAPRHVGGLMILEGSHLQHERLRSYLERDVDSYCSNRPEAEQLEEGFRNGKDLRSQNERWGGWLSKNPATLRERLGGRWLTTDFEAGDLLTFTMHTVHGSVDNRSDRYRISTDTRYQPASLPADERWIGENPSGHGMAGKRGRIC